MGLAPAIVEKLEEKAARFAELTEIVNAGGRDGASFARLLKERGQLAAAARLAERVRSLEARRREAQALVADAQVDPELVELAREELEGLEELEHELDREVKAELVSDPELQRDKVIVEIRAGTGGDEASLFVADLYQMYRHYVDQCGWRAELIEAVPTEVGGFKEVIFAIQGEGAWRRFRFESGGHRVQRVPQTESQGRIHTSAATVAVLAEPEDVEIDIRSDDLRIDTMRSGGAGGQHVNKVETAVRITHLPSGLVVVCQDEKSQHRNKLQAMRLLRTRLYDAEQRRIEAERAAERKSQVGTGERSQRVRTYNYPQNRVSDHRLGENFSLEQVAGGKFGPIQDALEELDREERIKRL